MLRSYSHALDEGRAEEAYRMLSDEARRGISLEAFKRMVKDNPEEVREIAKSLARPTTAPIVTATVTSSTGQELNLVLENGSWKVEATAIDLYAQDTPRHCIQGFVRAVERKRYDVVLKFVPDAHRGRGALLAAVRGRSAVVGPAVYPPWPMRRAWTALPVLVAVAIAGCGETGASTEQDPPEAPPRPTAPLHGRPSVQSDQGARPLVRTTVARGFVRPVAMLRDPNDPDRVLVVEQAGTARWLDGNRPAAGVPFMDLRSQVEFKDERGLLGAAFLPGYAHHPRIAVHYTDAKLHNRVVVYRVANGVVDPLSAQELLTIEQPYGNHNGGQLAIGPDDRLYVGIGDGGSAYDPRENGQNLDSPMGKVLRYDVYWNEIAPKRPKSARDPGGGFDVGESEGEHQYVVVRFIFSR